MLFVPVQLMSGKWTLLPLGNSTGLHDKYFSWFHPFTRKGWTCRNVHWSGQINWLNGPVWDSHGVDHGLLSCQLKRCGCRGWHTVRSIPAETNVTLHTIIYQYCYPKRNTSLFSVYWPFFIWFPVVHLWQWRKCSPYIFSHSPTLNRTDSVVKTEGTNRLERCNRAGKARTKDKNSNVTLESSFHSYQFPLTGQQ